MIWLLLALQMSLPTGVDPNMMRLPMPQSGRASDIRKLFSDGDFPTYLALANVSRSVGMRSTFTPDGQIRDCTIEHPSGDTSLDTYTCYLLVKRAKLAPARWIDGSPAWAVLRLPITWRLDDDSTPQSLSRKLAVPDLELSVTNLPKRAKGLADVYISLAVEPDGRMISCADFPLMGDLKDYWFPELVQTACQQAKAQLVMTPPKDSSGSPVRSMQTATIRFIANQ